MLHLTGALDEIVPAIRALPKDFSETFDGFARPVLAVRSSRTALIARSTETDWLFASMERMLAFSNTAFGFKLSGLERSMSVVQYEEGAALDWHVDTGTTNWSGEVRKVSLTLQLSAASEYAGGELEFCGCPPEPFAKTVGTVIAFPSFMSHRVTPLTGGMRLALVAFAVGPPFR